MILICDSTSCPYNSNGYCGKGVLVIRNGSISCRTYIDNTVPKEEKIIMEGTLNDI